MQISVEVNEHFAIKRYATTQTKALLYIYWLLMINTLFVEQISPKSTSLPKIFSVVLLCRGDFRSRAGQRKRSSFTDMQIWDEPWGFQTPPYDDTQGITDMKTGKNRGKELKNVWMNFSQTCRQKPKSQCTTMIYFQCNSIFHRHSIHYLTGENRSLSGLKNVWPVTVVLALDDWSIISTIDCLWWTIIY